jgi:hypothetical protein
MMTVQGAPDSDRPFLRIERDSLILWAAALFVVGLVPIVLTWSVATGDLSILAAAGRAVGTPALLHPDPAYNAFEYMPGAAWLCIPLAHLAHPVAFWCNALVMLGCAVAAALLAARIYGVTPTAATALTLAWAPVTNAIVLGQNAPLGLLLALATILGLARGSTLLTALPLGLLLYKPTFALPLLAVVVLFGRWRALAIVVLIGAGWYGASIAATGGDVAWPAAWLTMTAAYSAPDFAHNADKAVSIPGLLHRAGVPWAALAIVIAALAAAAVVPLRRAGVRDAASAACAIGLAISPHAWGYDAVLLLPLIFVAATSLREPARTLLVAVVYLTAPLVDYTSFFGSDVLAIPVIGGALVWIALGYRRGYAIADTAFADGPPSR